MSFATSADGVANANAKWFAASTPHSAICARSYQFGNDTLAGAVTSRACHAVTAPVLGAHVTTSTSNDRAASSHAHVTNNSAPPSTRSAEDVSDDAAAVESDPAVAIADARVRRRSEVCANNDGMTLWEGAKIIFCAKN